MHNIDNELLSHLITEFVLFGRSPIALNENGHHYENVDMIVDYFMKLFKNQVEDTFYLERITNKTYSGHVPFKTFFSRYTIDLTLSKGPKRYSGGLSPKSIKRNGDKSFICEPVMRINISAKDEDECYYTLSHIIGHEITHGWNLFQYAVKNNEDPSDTDYMKRYLSHVNAISDKKNTDSIEKSFSKIMYMLDRGERNALIAQLRQELKSMSNGIQGAKTIGLIQSFVKNTESYKTFSVLEKGINTICGITGPNVQNTFMKKAESATRKRFNTYNQMVKYFTNRWDKWKKIYLRNASKIAFDIHYEDPANTWIDHNVNLTDDLNIHEHIQKLKRKNLK